MNNFIAKELIQSLFKFMIFFIFLIFAFNYIINMDWVYNSTELFENIEKLEKINERKSILLNINTKITFFNTIVTWISTCVDIYLSYKGN